MELVCIMGNMGHPSFLEYLLKFVILEQVDWCTGKTDLKLWNNEKDLMWSSYIETDEPN